MSLDLRLRSFLIGLTTGSRSTWGLAAVTLTTPSPTPGTEAPERYLGGTGGKAVAALAAVGEGVADKLPQAPSRLEPGGLPARVLGGGSAAALLARRDETDAGLPALLGVGGALASSYAGAAFRAAAARRFGHDAWGAVIEDGVAALCAVLAVRR